jgi:hypothetical protein
MSETPSLEYIRHSRNPSSDCSPLIPDYSLLIKKTVPIQAVWNGGCSPQIKQTI